MDMAALGKDDHFHFGWKLPGFPIAGCAEGSVQYVFTQRSLAMEEIFVWGPDLHKECFLKVFAMCT